MNRIFKLPDYGADDLNITARLNYYLAAGFVVLSLLFVAVVIFIAPELARRSAMLAAGVIPVSITIMVLVRRNKLQAAGLVLAALLWLAI